MNPGIVATTLVLYMGALVVIGVWASRRTRDETDFFLGGRGLGPFVAALSYSASAASAWTLLGLSGAAWVLGLSALWIAAGATMTMLVAWFWIAPRLMRWTRDRDQITLTETLFHPVFGAILPAPIFDRVLSSWIALGSAFGPLVFVRLAGRTIPSRAVIASIFIGFVLAVGLPQLLTSPGMVVERTVPFLAACAVVLSASRRMAREVGGADRR